MSHTHDAPFSYFSAESAHEERTRRWRLILGQLPFDETHGEQGEPEQSGKGSDSQLSEQDQKMDRALESLYGEGDDGDLSDANPDIARWLGDIRTYFPAPVAQLMQQDVLKKFNLRRLLAQPELLAEIEPDLNLVASLLALKRVIPAQTRESAKQVVRQVVETLQQQLTHPLQQAIAGSLSRSTPTRQPRHRDINWHRTIRANLKHYQPDYQTIVPETMWGYGRKRASLRDVILCLDQSGSMTASVVYASIFAAVMASLPALHTRLVAFSTAVVDLTHELNDPVELLFGLQLRGGTDINRALAYCQQLVTRPSDTLLILISDLFESGGRERMLKRIATLMMDGVQVVVLLALDNKGAPRFDRQTAQALADLGVPAFACTPDLFPDLMSAALQRRDLHQWAAANDVVIAPSN